MSIASLVLLATAVALACVFFNPRLLRSQRWQATVTPLASIIGSGFLVVGPILATIAGTSAWAAMGALCAVAYLFGAAVRENILNVEPQLGYGASQTVAGLERASETALSFAYFVSVAYYLNLFAAFGLRLGDIADPIVVRVGATAVIAAIGVVGLLGGLDALERLEIGAVGLKLCVIGGLFAALILSDAMALGEGSFTWQAPFHAHRMEELRVLLGLVILVQGFETSRYLGATYDATTRVRTMRYAQWISAGVYMVFILTITPFFGVEPPLEHGETAIIDMLRPIGSALAPMVILAALASQLSAAVADTNGAGGLLSEASRRRLRVNTGNVITAAAAIAITWTADIYQIITCASKMFVIYYGLQSMQATLSAWRRGSPGKALLFLLAVLIALGIVLFAIPASV